MMITSAPKLKRLLRERADRLGHRLEPRFQRISYLGLPTTRHEILCADCGVVFTVDEHNGAIEISAQKCAGKPTPLFYDHEAPQIDVERFKTQVASGLLSAGLDVQHLEDGLFGLALRVGCPVADQAYLTVAPYFGAGDAYKESHGYDTDRNSVLVVVLHGEHNTNPLTGYTSWEHEEEYSEWVEGLDPAGYIDAALKLVEAARADGLPV